MQLKPHCHQKIIIEKEEYEALMAELSTPEFDSKTTHDPQAITEKIRKIEFYMMIIVGLILVVLMLSKAP